MAEPNTVPDENSSFEDKIAYLRSKNISEDKIAQHFTNVDDPNAQAWVRNYKTQQAQTAATQAIGPASTASSSAPNPINTSGVQALGNVANQAANWYANLSTPEKIAYPVGTILGTYAGGKVISGATDLVFNNLRDRQEIRKQAALNALDPSAAVKVQQDQLKLQQAEQANRFAQQAAGANAAPVEDRLLNARVQTETQRAATESARTEAAKHEAALAQERLIAAQRKAAMVKANPAGAAAQIAAAEGLPVEAQPAVAAKPTVADLQQKLGIVPEAGKSTPLETTVFSPENVPSAQGAVTPPANVEPVPVVPTTPTEVVTDPTTTPVEKVVKLTPETPATGTTATAETPKVAGAVEPQVLRTGTNKPAYLGQGPTTGKFKSSYPDVASVPKDYAFVPEAHSINTLRNNINQETFTKEYTNRPYPANYAEALQQGKDINASLGRMTREEMIAKGIPLPNVVPGIGAQIGQEIETGAGGVKGSRRINVGLNGVMTAGMLVALSDLAKADSLNEARSIAGETALGLMPPGAQAMLYMKGAGEGENADMAFRRRMEAAKALGAGNRGKAFDPRIPYNSALSDIGIPPPYGR
jgi:hypothetical protein